jgi:cobalamin synthase
VLSAVLKAVLQALIKALLKTWMTVLQILLLSESKDVETGEWICAPMITTTLAPRLVPQALCKQRKYNPGGDTGEQAKSCVPVSDHRHCVCVASLSIASLSIASLSVISLSVACLCVEYPQ